MRPKRDKRVQQRQMFAESLHPCSFESQCFGEGRGLQQRLMEDKPQLAAPSTLLKHTLHTDQRILLTVTYVAISKSGAQEAP